MPEGMDFLIIGMGYFVAIISISTNAFFGNSLAATHDLAGFDTKYSSYTLFFPCGRGLSLKVPLKIY